MKTIQLNNEKYDMPTSWDEVTLEMQLKVSADADKIIDNQALQRIALISGYAGIPIEVIKKTPVTKITKMFQHLSFINQPLPKEPITEFEFKGETYGITQDILNQQFQDFVSLETLFQNHKDKTYEALPEILAILCKKEGETLDDYDVAERAELFKQLPMTIVEPIRLFFSLFAKTSYLTTQLSSKENQEKVVNAKVKELKDILNKQAGGGLLTRLLRGMLRRWIKYFEKNAKRYFSTIQ